MKGEVLIRLVRLMVGLIGRRCQQDCSGTLRTGDVISVSRQLVIFVNTSARLQVFDGSRRDSEVSHSFRKGRGAEAGTRELRRAFLAGSIIEPLQLCGIEREKLERIAA
jgi:hypothetical protein